MINDNVRQIDDPCEGGRCHMDKESGTFLPCKKHNCGHSSHDYDPVTERYECCSRRSCDCTCVTR